MDDMTSVKNILARIYGEEKGNQAFKRLIPVIEKYPPRAKKNASIFSEKDVFLITYGDTLKREGEAPINTLHKFARSYLKDAVSTIHFLPFFPYSSDDGFSVVDFHAINPELGTWDDVTPIGEDFRLMFDYVVNHYSSKSEWFADFLSEKDGFQDFAIVMDPSTDLSLVTRPRSLPLLSEYTKNNGETVHLWTTFSADQIDFNFESLNVLERMIDVLLFYVQQGATVLRLDAIGFLWKEIGTTSMHLPQTHDVVKLMRAILDIVAPDVIIITETNVPHAENISYFGDGRDEAQMVYNFTLPPLLFYTFVKEDSSILSSWAQGLQVASDGNTFFNFTASHDGIGVRPLEGILPREEIDALIEVVTSNNGKVSYKDNPDGTQSPYELNITYVDAYWRRDSDDEMLHSRRFLASQSIQYSLPGVPATYIHSLLGSRNWVDGVTQTGMPRTVNREKLDIDSVISELKNPDSFRSKIFHPYLKMIKIRKMQSAFHPNAAFEILDIDRRLFAIKRTSENQTIFAVTNISSRDRTVSLNPLASPGQLTDLLSGTEYNTGAITLAPYQYLWLGQR